MAARPPRAPFRIATVDDRLGDQLEALTRRHHRRRLTRQGWADALDPVEATDDDWWAPRARLRDGNRLQVLVDGVTALAEIERAIAGAQRSVEIAGWCASPDFRLSQEQDAPALRDLLAQVATRVPVRVLLWAGPPVPAMKPTRRQVAQMRQEFLRDSRVECELDKRERTMHCHHEKLVVVDERIAFVGGIDLTHVGGDRLDASDHPRAESIGWHDCATRIEGPAVEDVLTHVRNRWQEVTGRHTPAPAPQQAAGTTRLAPEQRRGHDVWPAGSAHRCSRQQRTAARRHCARSHRSQQGRLRAREGRDHRRPLAHGGVGQPQRALAVQRHRDERGDR